MPDGWSADGGDRVLANCNLRAEARGTKCSLFASEEQILGDGPISYQGSSNDYLFIYSKEVSTGKRGYSGTGNLADGGRKIDLSARNCWGEADLNTKKWFLKGCSNDETISGTFISGEGIKKYIGIGRGSMGGGSVDMLILDPSADPRFTKEDSSSNKKVCNFAIDRGGETLKWDGKYRKFVDEAKRRKLTVVDCKKLLGS